MWNRKDNGFKSIISEKKLNKIFGNKYYSVSKKFKIWSRLFPYQSNYEKIHRQIMISLSVSLAYYPGNFTFNHLKIGVFSQYLEEDTCDAEVSNIDRNGNLKFRQFSSKFF